MSSFENDLNDAEDLASAASWLERRAEEIRALAEDVAVKRHAWNQMLYVNGKTISLPTFLEKIADDVAEAQTQLQATSEWVTEQVYGASPYDTDSRV